ncbi:MAG: HAMP domain-containing histidine kinase [Planctomycetes bacterium]|nr:HAMP domain-containing histidine kinase [Planctomycetota bacterium]
MMRGRLTVLGFAACVLAVLGGLAWLTFHVLRLERLEVEARAATKRQEAIRLVLWRMDSALTPIIAREAARPYFEYQPFYAADLAFANINKAPGSRDVMVPSPLLSPPDEYVRLHFQDDGAQGLSSPQVPRENEVRLAEGVYVSGYAVASAAEKLAKLEALIKPLPAQVLTFNEPTFASPTGGLPSTPPGAAEPQQVYRAESGVAPGSTPPVQVLQQQSSDLSLVNEYQARQQATDRAKAVGENSLRNSIVGKPQAAIGPVTDKEVPAKKADGADEERKDQEHKKIDRADGDGALYKSGASAGAILAPGSTAKAPGRRSGAGKDLTDAGLMGKASESEKSTVAGDALRSEADDSAMGPGVKQGQFVARWVPVAESEPELLFVREVDFGERCVHQGFWLDWPALRAMLLASAKDLLPTASLRPVVDPSRLAADQEVLGRTLAAIPAELVLPPAAPALMPSWSPVRTTVLVTWIAALAAVIVTALVLRASLELAERRGRFVSAVTHELRTPLTTFCLYSQMLADGMVQDEDARMTYFGTLKSESQRLARIVESVLDYARLSGKRTTKAIAAITVADLVTSLKRPLAARCEQSGMSLCVEGDQSDSRVIETDAGILERIVFNLVDNACKYASEATDKRVCLSFALNDSQLQLCVRDFGPGIARAESSRLFRPFVRGERHGHGAIPGLGLGLAIASGLAKELGGNLDLADAAKGGGACFCLTLPRSPRA